MFPLSCRLKGLSDSFPSIININVTSCILLKKSNIKIYQGQVSLSENENVSRSGIKSFLRYFASKANTVSAHSDKDLLSYHWFRRKSLMRSETIKILPGNRYNNVLPSNLFRSRRSVLLTADRYQVSSPSSMFPMQVMRRQISLNVRSSLILPMESKCEAVSQSWRMEYERTTLSSSIKLNDASTISMIGNICHYTTRLKDIQECSSVIKKNVESKDPWLRGRSWNDLIFTSLRINHSWNFSKQYCSSASKPFDGTSTTNLSTSTFRFYSSADNPNRRNSAMRQKCEKTRDPRETTTESEKSCNNFSSTDRDLCNRIPEEQYNKTEESCSEYHYTAFKGDSKTCNSTGDSQDCTASIKDPCPPSSSPCPRPPSKSPCPCPKPENICPEEEPEKVRIWRFLSLFIGLPLVLLASTIIYSRVEEERKQPRPPYYDVPYMYRITKPFPWGDGKHTLFHNPVLNPVRPHGYEVDDPYEVKKKKEN